MTTLVAVRKNDEIAIAADSLTTFGDTRLSARVRPTLREDRPLQGHVHRPVRQRRAPARVREPAREARRSRFLEQGGDLRDASASCIRSSRSSTSSIPKEEEDDPYESTQVTALVANEHGIFGVYSMREVFEYTRYWAVGLRPRVRAGRDVRAVPELRTAGAIARAGIDAGATFDRNSGLPMTLYTVAAARLTAPRWPRRAVRRRAHALRVRARRGARRAREPRRRVPRDSRPASVPAGAAARARGASRGHGAARLDARASRDAHRPAAGRRAGRPARGRVRRATSACARPRNGRERCRRAAGRCLARAARRRPRDEPARDHARSRRTAARSTRASSRSRPRRSRR